MNIFLDFEILYFFFHLSRHLSISGHGPNNLFYLSMRHKMDAWMKCSTEPVGEWVEVNVTDGLLFAVSHSQWFMQTH